MIQLASPILIEVSQDDSENALISERLEMYGFMRKNSLKSVCPYYDFLDDFYNHQHTSPVYFLLTSPECDETADGYTAELIGYNEYNRLIDKYGSIHTMSATDAINRLL